MIARSWRLLLAAPLLVIGLDTAGHAVELNPAALIYKLPDQLKWRDPTGAAPVNQAILQGDPTKAGGIYVVLNRFKPGAFSRPHFHPNDRYITVVKGTWWVATGNKVDKEQMVADAGGQLRHALRQAGALGRRQGRGSLGADRRRRPGHQHAGRRGQMKSTDRGQPIEAT